MSRCPIASSSASVARAGEGETSSGMRGVKKARENERDRGLMEESEWRSETGDESGAGSGTLGPEAEDIDAPEGAEGPEAPVFPKSLSVVTFIVNMVELLLLRIWASVVNVVGH